MRPEKWWRQYKESGEILPGLVRDKWSPRIPAVLRRSSSSSPSPSPTSSPTSKCYMGECTVTPFPLFISPLIDPLLALMSGGASSSTSSPSYSPSSTSSTPSLHIITSGYSVKMWFLINASWTLLSHMVLKSFYCILLKHILNPPTFVSLSGFSTTLFRCLRQWKQLLGDDGYWSHFLGDPDNRSQ